MRNRIHQILEQQILNGGRKNSRKNSRKHSSKKRGSALVGGRKKSSRRGAALVGGRKKRSRRGAALVGGRKKRSRRGAALCGGRRRRNYRGSALVGGAPPSAYATALTPRPPRVQLTDPDSIAFTDPTAYAYNSRVKDLYLDKADEMYRFYDFLDTLRHDVVLKNAQIEKEAEDMATSAAIAELAEKNAREQTKSKLASAKNKVKRSMEALEGLFSESIGAYNPTYANIPYGKLLNLAQSGDAKDKFFF